MPSSLGPRLRARALLLGLLLAPTLAMAQAAPNLTLDQLAVSTAAQAGAPLALSFDVVVREVRAPFTWTAYLSTSGAVVGARALGTFGPVTPTADGRMRVNGSVSIPADAAGRFFVVVQLQPSVADSNPYDDALASDDRVSVTARQADLVVRSVRLVTARARSGDPVTLTAVVENAGAIATDVVLVALADRDATTSTSDRELARTTITVAAGATSQVTLSGAIPAGTEPGRYVVGVLADPDGVVDEVDESNNLVVAAAPLSVFEETLALTTANLPNGTVFQRYYGRLDARGGDGVYQYTITHGRLPAGLSLGFASGAITGAPLTSGPFEVTVEVRSDVLVAERVFSFEVAQSGVELSVVTPELPSGTLGLPYVAELAAAGGEPPYQWTVINGNVAPGLDLSTAGRISGVPHTEGTFGFMVEVRDALGGRVRTAFELRVDPANVIITSVRLEPLPLGEPARVELTVKGGAAPYAWEALSAPPPGLTLREDGVLMGTPGRVGRFATRVRVTDGTEHAHSDTALVLVEVLDGGNFSLVMPEVRRLGLRESLYVTLSVEGGKPPFSWRVDPRDELPDGFYFEPAALGEGEAVLRGESVRPIDRAFAVEVTDKTGRTRQGIVALHVDAATSTGAGSGGCTCVAPSASPSRGALAILALGALVLFGRRRRAPRA